MFGEVEPLLDVDKVDALMENEGLRKALCTLLDIELRQCDQRKLVEFMGDDKVIEILKTMTGIFFQPLMNAYQSANIGDLLSVIKDTANRILAVAENKCASPSASFGAYREILDSLEAPLFAFVHELFTKDDGSMEKTIKWTLALFDIIRKDRDSPYTLQIGSILEGIHPWDRSTLWKELALLDDLRFRKWFARDLRLKAATIDPEEAFVDGKLSIENIMKFQASESSVGEELGLSGYVSDEDLDDISNQNERPFEVSDPQSFPFLCSLIPLFVR